MVKCAIEVFWLRRIRGARSMHQYTECESIVETVSLFLLFLKWGCRGATFYRVTIDM